MKKDHYKFSALYSSGKRGVSKIPKNHQIALQDLEEYIEECMDYISFSRIDMNKVAYKAS